jgi:hypothetical protein
VRSECAENIGSVRVFDSNILIYHLNDALPPSVLNQQALLALLLIRPQRTYNMISCCTIAAPRHDSMGHLHEKAQALRLNRVRGPRHIYNTQWLRGSSAQLVDG